MFFENNITWDNFIGPKRAQDLTKQLKSSSSIMGGHASDRLIGPKSPTWLKIHVSSIIRMWLVRCLEKNGLKGYDQKEEMISHMIWRRISLPSFPHLHQETKRKMFLSSWYVPKKLHKHFNPKTWKLFLLWSVCKVILFNLYCTNCKYMIRNYCNT